MNRHSHLHIKGISIAKELLDKRFAPCNLRACRHACCKDGAVIGTPRINKIERLLPRLFPLMRPEAVAMVKSKGFHVAAVFTRSDMSTDHEHHYIRTVNGKCVFLNYDDSGGCVLQKYGAMNNMKYKLKPVGCRAFPFDLIGNRLTVYKWKCLPCLDDAKNRTAPPIYTTCRNELIGFLGQDGYKELLVAMAVAKGTSGSTR
jgi:hypothetical protein